MAVTLTALSALHPRDEIEVLLSVQALCAFHAAAVCWHIECIPGRYGIRVCVILS
jgi:hypothetical protein